MTIIQLLEERAGELARHDSAHGAVSVMHLHSAASLLAQELRRDLDILVAGHGKPGWRTPEEIREELLEPKAPPVPTVDPAAPIAPVAPAAPAPDSPVSAPAPQVPA